MPVRWWRELELAAARASAGAPSGKTSCGGSCARSTSSIPAIGEETGARARAGTPASRREAAGRRRGVRPSASTKGRGPSATSSRASPPSSIRRPEIDGSLAPRAHGGVGAGGAGGRGAGARALRRGGRGEPERLAEVEERSFRLQKLLRKHGPTTPSCWRTARAVARARRARERVRPRRRARGAQERARSSRGGRQRRAALSRKRREAADAGRRHRARAVAARDGARARRGRRDADARRRRRRRALVDGARLTRAGIDRVEFLIAPNRGEEPRPLRKIASGGELSRALLALKRVLADQGPGGDSTCSTRSTRGRRRHRRGDRSMRSPTSRATARSSASRTCRRSRRSPTLTSSSTRARPGRTHATVRRLSAAERVDEIARMIGGIKVGDAARRAAAEMLGTRARAGQLAAGTLRHEERGHVLAVRSARGRAVRTLAAVARDERACARTARSGCRRRAHRPLVDRVDLDLPAARGSPSARS
jgi:DNA repair protein RecN (Recombination protein N)